MISLSPTMLATATQQLQRQLSVENLNLLLSSLTQSEATYVRDLGQSVVSNFASPSFSLDDWRQVNSIFRFVVLAKTSKCNSIVPSRTSQEIVARNLCNQFSFDEKTISMVFDMTSREFAERALAQNQRSWETIGRVIQNPFSRCVDGSELFSIVLAIATAFLRPGKNFCVYKQKHWCGDVQLVAFDMNYYVDPASLLLVVWGKVSA